MRKRIEVGDVFQVRLTLSKVKYLQYIADDSTMLSSYVIRAFKQGYSTEEAIDCGRIIQGEVDFHAHTFVKNGIKFGTWQKVGHGSSPEPIDVLFRCSRDYGNPEVKISKRWYVWQVNGPEIDVGVLPPKYQHAEIGVVIPPDWVVHRMIYGHYDFVFPSF